MKPKHLISIALIVLTIQNSIGQIPNWNWARSASGNSSDEAITVATDQSGNVYISGYYTSDSLVFGTNTLQNAGLSFNDLFLAKYDSSGNLIWVRRFGGTGNDRGTSVTTDKDGNIYLTGYFYSPTIVFDTDTLTNAGAVGDIFVVKFDSQGKVIWAKRDGGPALEIPYSITLDNQNNIIVTGRFSSLSITFGTTTLLQKGSMDVFVVKYDNSGNVLWAKGAGGGSNDEGYSVSTDSSGNIYVAGYFTQPANFDAIKLTSNGLSDMFLAKYDPEGNLIWARSAGGIGDDRATCVKTDALGNSYISGYFTNDSISFGSIVIPNETGENSFIAKYDTDGNMVWAKGMGGDSQAFGLALSGNNVYVCGSFNGDTLRYASTNLLIDGHSDLFLLNCDTDANPKWVVKQTSAGESGEAATSVTTDNSGNIIISGYYSSKPIFFGTSELNTSGGFDLFVAKLGSVSTGTEDLNKASEFQIYPNPGNGHFVLQNKFKVKAIEIYTISGSKIYSRNFIKKQGSEEIDISAFPSGIYIASLSDGEKSFTQKLVIRKD